MSEIWCLVNGAWGDALACYGNICHLLDQRGLEKSNVVFYGLDPDIVSFLKCQDRIDKVYSLLISDPELYFKYAGLAAGDFPAFMKITGLNQKIPDLNPTHINRYYNIENPNLCHRVFSVKLPETNVNWQTFYDSNPNYLLFQPFSCHSCLFESHWNHWIDALRWVLDNHNFRVVLTGQLTSGSDHRFKFPWIDHPNLFNMVGQTESMFEVLRIMQGAKGVVTTSNALSMWSIATKIPALVVCNQIIKERAFYYYNWIHHEPNVVLESTSTLEDFKVNFKSFVSGLDLKS